VIPYLLAAIALFAVAMVAAAVWSGQLPWLNVVTGAKPTGPAGMAPPEPEPYNALPWESNPKEGGARASLAPQAPRRATRVSDLPHQTTRRRYP
jgi:hypothetical protein